MLDDVAVWNRWVGDMNPAWSGPLMGGGAVIIAMWLASRILHAKTNAPNTVALGWHDELKRCHAAFLEYMKVPASSPISNEEIAATQAFLPHVHELCRLLDKQGIPHPVIPDGLVFDHTGKWGDFMARLLAVRGDLDEARKVEKRV